MLTLDEIEFETPDEATLTLDDVQFDPQAAQTPARRPASRSRKRLRTKIPGGKVTAEDLKVRVPRTQLLDRVLQGEELDIQGGDQVTTISNTPASFDFQQPITELTTSTTPVRITPGRPRKQPDESVEAFVRRSKEFEDKQAQVEQRRKALRAQTRAKTLPSQGLEKYPTAIAQGVEEVLRPAIVAAAEWAGVEPPEWAKQENILPRLGEADAAEWGTKVATGLGSTIPQIPLGIATGGAGTIVLGALSNAGQTYEEAKAMGASDQDALAASVPGALIGSLEGVLGLGSGQLAGQLAKGTIKTFAGDVTKDLFQELTNQALNNVNAKYVSGYDPQRSLTEGLWDTFTTTLPIAGGFNVGQLANGGLKRSGVEFSVGPLEQEKLGTTLYSGLDPSLIREYLPRPETLRNLFSQLFSSKQVGTPPEITDKLTSLAKKLTDQAFDTFAITREKEINEFNSAFPESLDDWTVDRYLTTLKDHWPAINEHLSGSDIDEIMYPSTYFGEELYSPDKEYTISSKYVPTEADPEKYILQMTAKDSEGNEIATVNSTSTDGLHTTRLQLAAQIVKQDLINKASGKPVSNHTLMFIDQIRQVKNREKFKLEQKLDRDYRTITKHIYRWLDKQKYEMLKQLEQAQPNETPLDIQVTSEPQGIVVHKISYDKLDTLLYNADWKLSKAKQPSPSIGIIHPETDFDSFGDIQLIATPSVVNESVESGTAYPTDFYTPTVSDILSFASDGPTEITPENADAISKSMVDQMRNYAEARLDNPGEIFDNSALFSSYAKAGGSWASKQELIKGLATLKAATTKSAIPEFQETDQIKARFSSKKQQLQLQLRNAFAESLAISTIFQDEPQEFSSRFRGIKKTLDGYLLTQLSKETFPSVEEFTTGLRNALIKYHPELGVALGKNADPNSELIRALEDFTPTALATFQAFRDVPSIYMEVQPTRAIHLDEYVAALLPMDSGTSNKYLSMADTLTKLGLKVYRYSNPEEKIAIQKALAQFKDLTVNPDSSYGALYSNPIFNPDLWKSLIKSLRKDDGSINLADYEYVPKSGELPTSDENVDPALTPENLFEPVLRPEVVAESARRFRQLITDSGLQYDPKLPAHLNLAKAIGEGKLNLESLGLTPDDYAVFAKDLAQSASEYGRGLQAVGQTQIFYERLVKENPEQAKRLAEAGLSPQIVRAALRTLRATQYGQSLWERMGALPRKMALTLLSTFWTNVWGTLGFLPLTILDGAITGLGLQALDPKRYSQDSELSLAQKATKRIKEGMRPATNLLLAMTPKSLGAVLNRNTGMEKFDQVAKELELLHPDIYTKLHGVEHSTLKQETADVTVSLLREVLPLMPNGKERLEVEQKFKEIDRHQRFNKSLAGKAYGKTEWAYDYLLRPMTWQEYAFRRPFFVGALQRELAQEGLDLWDLVASGNLSAASRPAIEKAVDAALEFTWSYMPHERDHGVIEASTNTLIKTINKLGPVGFLVEAFPRAIYNGLKFWYEWGPWGGVTPAIKTISNLSKSRRDAIAYRDIQRISRAALGTILYGAALSLRSSAGGEEWWQLATGRKDSKGRPIYFNAKRIPQLAFFLWTADFVQRVAEQRDVDKKFQQEGLELYASMRRTGSTEQLGAVDAFLDWWQEKDNSESAARGLARPAGQLLALPLTPFINVRNIWGQFSTDEAARKDLRDEPLTAPALDRLPWFRRRLPNFQSPTETGITPTSNDPLTTVAPGIVFDPGTSFAGREFARLGITPYHWLKRDASPKIDRAQFAMYSKILESIGESLSQDPSYLQASDLEKAARWEALLAGPDGIAAIAREAGLAADPNEAAKRELRKAIPPLRRRANPALNDKIKSIGK